MLQKTYYTNGKNEFDNYEFNDDQWSAPYMVDKDEISDTLNSFNLVGRKIKDIRFVAYAYNLNRHWIEEYVFNNMEGCPEEERHKYSEYNNITPDFPFLRYAEIDEPFLIKFEDEDRFEIDAPREPEFRMSMNCIPWDIDPNPRGNVYNVDASVIFDTCIGKTIDNVEVKTYLASEEPMTIRKFPDGKERELVSSIILWLNDNTGICIEPRYDYFYITLINHSREPITIPFKKLKDGLYNWEDLHDDEDTGFRSYCSTIWFGGKCRDIMGTTFIGFIPEGKKQGLQIFEDDLMLFFLAVSVVIGETFDIYEDYKLSYEQWNAVLDEADRLLGIKTQDELQEYFVGMKSKTNGKCDVLYYLEYYGKEFIDNKKLRAEEAEAVRSWTEIVLEPGKKMEIIGM